MTKDQLTLCILGNLHCLLLIFFFKTNFFSKNSFRNTTRVSNSFDSDQDRRFVGPDLGLNCLQKLLADDTSRHRPIKEIV